MRYKEPKDSPPVFRLTPLIRKSYLSTYPPRDSVSPSAHFRLFAHAPPPPPTRRPDSRRRPPSAHPPSPVVDITSSKRPRARLTTWFEPPDRVTARHIVAIARPHTDTEGSLSPNSTATERCNLFCPAIARPAYKNEISFV